MASLRRWSFCNPDNLTRTLEIANVAKDYPPTILLHGDKDDEDVPYEESVRMAKALTARGITNEFVTIPGAPHLFDNDMTRLETRDAFIRCSNSLPST
jgi:dipeptidyl aminopeptidase/acylaminoacyl peptidase